MKRAGAFGPQPSRKRRKMSKLKRKIEKSQKRKKTKEAQEKVSEKLGMFDRIPDACLICEKSFDKKDKDMVFSWSVVVHNETEAVRLFCPECIEKTKELIEQNESS